VLPLVGALVVVAIVRKGAFYPPYDVGVPAAALIVAVVAVARRPVLDRRDAIVCGALLLFAGWWSFDAVQSGSWSSARQVVGSAVGFTACYAIGRTLQGIDRERLRECASVVGAALAALGLVGVALRIEPLALPAQGHLRLAGTLTYSNATGALLAMLLVVAVTTPRSRWRDAEIVLLTGGLVATQSRGALLATLLAMLLVRRRVGTALLPMGLGVVLCVVAFAGLALSSDESLVDAAQGRLSRASVDDRTAEWRAGWREFAAAPVTGAGPGTRLRLADGRTARFVHNEPLQAAADSGLIGLALLTTAFAAPLLARRTRPGIEAASAVLTVFVVCGLLDFPWHLPAIPMVAGLLLTGLPERTPASA
jgi:O-antigen ligase